jgi:hypothetical protein
VRSDPSRRVVPGGTHRDVVVRTATRRELSRLLVGFDLDETSSTGAMPSRRSGPISWPGGTVASTDRTRSIWLANVWIATTLGCGRRPEKTMQRASMTQCLEAPRTYNSFGVTRGAQRRDYETTRLFGSKISANSRNSDTTWTAWSRSTTVRRSTPETSAISYEFSRGPAIKTTPNSRTLVAICNGSITSRACEVSKSAAGKTSRIGSNSMCA